MKIAEVTQKPPTPEQLRIKSLADTKERAADALAAERQRQQVAKAQKQLAQMRQPKQAQTQG